MGVDNTNRRFNQNFLFLCMYSENEEPVQSNLDLMGTVISSKEHIYHFLHFTLNFQYFLTCVCCELRGFDFNHLETGQYT